MNRNQFADSLILDMGYNDVATKLDRRQVFADIDKHFPLILVQVANQFGDGILNNFSVTTILPVSYDTGFGQYFIDTSSIVPMNLKGFAGIRQIGDTQTTDNDYVPVQGGWMSLMSRLEVGGLANRRGFLLQGNRPYIVNPPVDIPSALRVTYVPTIMNLSDIDEITCPAETLSMLCDKLMEVLTVQKNTPQNVNNDNKDTQ